MDLSRIMCHAFRNEIQQHIAPHVGKVIEKESQGMGPERVLTPRFDSGVW